MSEKGIVVDVRNSGSIAIVSFTRTEACAKCRACAIGMSESQMLLEAKNDLNAKIGDSVLIELPDKGFLAASAIMYIFPLAAAFLGFAAGSIVSDIFGFTLGIALLLASYLIIRGNERLFKRQAMFTPYITEVIPSPRLDLEDAES